MTDRPILFSAPMVRALLDGTKTQTRRALKPQPSGSDAIPPEATWAPDNGFKPTRKTGQVWALHSPYLKSSRLLHAATWVRFAIGDRLWVREAWCTWAAHDNLPPRDLGGNRVEYRATDKYRTTLGRWRPGIHMPRWASRLTLTITDVRVERLQDISEADALAEGVVWSDEWHGFIVPGVEHPNHDFPVLSRSTPREMYAALWDTLHGPGAWNSNPWVVAVSFDVAHHNIDRIAA